MMTQVRAVARVFQAYDTVEGAGVRLHRAFGFYEVPQFDPFLMLDDFRSDRPEDYLAGFPWHPHRGIETVTYILEGAVVENGDSIGNAGTIRGGDVQWMTAGSGVIHQEMPKQSMAGWGGSSSGSTFPARTRWSRHGIAGSRPGIPTVSTRPDVNIRVISGNVGGTEGPVKVLLRIPSSLR